MIISHRHKFIFIHIPKTGGTSITKALMPFLGIKDLTGKDSHEDPLYHHRTAQEIKKIVGEKIWNSYFKFAVVRNPWDLMVSEFHYFKNTPYLKNIVPKYDEKIKNYSTFRTFIEAEEKNTEKPYLKYILDENGKNMVDYVATLENIDSDFEKIIQRIGLRGLKMIHDNQSEHKHYSNYYDNKTKLIVEKLFKNEIKKFDYKFEERKKKDNLMEMLENLRKKISNEKHQEGVFSLITSLYNETHEDRLGEYIYCLDKNIKNILIKDIHVFYDDSKDTQNNLLLEYIKKQKKVKIKIISGRPTYKELFTYANDNFSKNSKVIVSNGDIYFDETLGLVKNKSLENIFLALTRWNQDKKGKIAPFVNIITFETVVFCPVCSSEKWLKKKSDFFLSSYVHPCKITKNCNHRKEDLILKNKKIIDLTASSQDAWIFQTPLEIDFNADIPLGTYHCDSYLNYQLVISKLNAYNPQKDIKAIHFHTSEIKSQDDQENIKNDKARNNEMLNRGFRQSIIPLCDFSEIPFQIENKNQPTDEPEVSIITSVFNGEKYIKEFLKNITGQTLFNKCELILINANSPTNEEKTINEYVKKYPNIIYKKLDKDPGLYSVWNMAIKLARGKYITNANLDDRRAKNHIEECLKELHHNSNLDLICTELYVTKKDNDIIGNADKNTRWFSGANSKIETPDMFKENIVHGKRKVYSQNIPHCMPIWKKSLHEKNGFFNENEFGPLADWEFWLRCLKNNANFKIIHKPLGLYLINNDSHNRKTFNEVFHKKIVDRYYKATESQYLRKINTAKIMEENYGSHHRSGWNFVMNCLVPLHSKSGVLLDPFIEKKFSFGAEPGEAKNNPTPYNIPWIGFVHKPQNIPALFSYEKNLEEILESEAFKESLKYCKGLFCLSEHNKKWLEKRVPVMVEKLVHPTQTSEIKFNFKSFLENPDKKIIQIGFWLRRLNSIYLLKTDNFSKMMTVINDFMLDIMEQERKSLGIKIKNSDVIIEDRINNINYDKLLSENIVFLDLYESSANNAIVECIVRETPLLINPLPAVIEYLGKDYPFYFSSLEEASRKAEDLSLIKKTNEYLKKMDKQIFTREYFMKSFTNSKIYKSLQ